MRTVISQKYVFILIRCFFFCEISLKIRLPTCPTPKPLSQHKMEDINYVICCCCCRCCCFGLLAVDPFHRDKIYCFRRLLWSIIYAEIPENRRSWWRRRKKEHFAFWSCCWCGCCRCWWYRSLSWKGETKTFSAPATKPKWQHQKTPHQQ